MRISIRRCAVAASIAMALSTPGPTAASGPFCTSYAERDFAVFYKDSGGYLIPINQEQARRLHEMNLSGFYHDLPRLLSPVRETVAAARARGIPLEPHRSYLWGIRIEESDVAKRAGSEALRRSTEGPFPQNIVLTFEEYGFWFTVSGPVSSDDVGWLREQLAGAIEKSDERDNPGVTGVGGREVISHEDVVVPRASLETERVAVCARNTFGVRPVDLREYESQLRGLVKVVKRRFDAQVGEDGIFAPLGVRPLDLAEVMRQERRARKIDAGSGSVCDDVWYSSRVGEPVALIRPAYEKPNLVVEVVLALGSADAEAASWPRGRNAVRKLVNATIPECRAGACPDDPGGDAAEPEACCGEWDAAGLVAAGCLLLALGALFAVLVVRHLRKH